MSGKRKINDDELTGLIKEGLCFTENEKPVVTKELMDKTMNFIMENENSTKEESGTEKHRSPHKRWIPGVAACAACLVLIAGAITLRHMGITKPDTKNNTTEIAMDYSRYSDESLEAEGSGSDGFSEFNEKPDFESLTGGSAKEESIDDSSDGCEDETSITNKDFSDASPADGPQASFGSENKDMDAGKEETVQKNDDYDISAKDRISGSEIDFPENILGCTVQDIISVISENANGETRTIDQDDIRQFCNQFEKELSSKKDVYAINSIAYHQLPNDWKKKILILSEDSYGEYKFHNIFVYEDSFAVCPFPEAETDPGLMCTMYE